ncbi:hypothetical protein F8S13_03015 [Chloroflexia bacterium SDU3-3]|nr:hypothetical protein F8S13_03015 [Chloroflexia bacterium SDU3-3]
MLFIGSKANEVRIWLALERQTHYTAIIRQKQGDICGHPYLLIMANGVFASSISGRPTQHFFRPNTTMQWAGEMGETAYIEHLNHMPRQHCANLVHKTLPSAKPANSKNAASACFSTIITSRLNNMLTV